MSTARTGMDGRLTPENKLQVEKLIAEGMPVRQVAKRLGFSHTTIHRLRVRMGWGPPPRRDCDRPAKAKRTAEGKEAERNRKRAARTRSRGQAEPPTPISAPADACDAPRPVLRAPRPGPLSRAEELAMVEAAIAAGIGSRFEWPRAVRVPLSGAEEATRWLDEQGIGWSVRRRGTHLEYRVQQHGGAWLPAARFASAIRAEARNAELICLPLREIYQPAALHRSIIGLS